MEARTHSAEGIEYRKLARRAPAITVGILALLPLTTPVPAPAYQLYNTSPPTCVPGARSTRSKSNF